MKKYKLILLFICGIFYWGESIAQDETPNYKWGLGVDILSVGEWNNYPRYSLFATRVLGDNGLALRTRLGGSYMATTNQIPHEHFVNNEYFDYDATFNRNLTATLGIQRNIYDFNNNNVLYTGFDIIFIHEKNTTKKVNSYFYENVTYYSFEEMARKTRTVFGSAFLGYTRMLTNRIELRFEVALESGGFKNSLNGISFPIDEPDRTIPFKIPNGTPTAFTTYYTKSSFIRLNPYSQLLLILKL